MSDKTIITLYSKNNCPACDRAKAQLTAAGVEFIIRNIDKDMEAMDWIVKQRHRSIPVLYRNDVHVPNINDLLI